MTGRIIRSSSRADAKERSKSNTCGRLHSNVIERKLVMPRCWADLRNDPSSPLRENVHGATTYMLLLYG